MEATAAQYHREMSKFIYDAIQRGEATQSRSEPGKLSKLSPMQFQELATDVYDELNRRKYDYEDIPFLKVRDHYHPKRNQARQKLATLSSSKFVDLAHDVNEDLKRRFPHKIEASSSYETSPHDSASYEPAANRSSGYNSGHYLQPQQHTSALPGYSSHQSNRRTPPPPGSRNSSRQGHGGHSRGLSISAGEENSLESVDRAANDLNHAIKSSQTSNYNNSSLLARVPTPDQRNVRTPSNSGEIEKLRNEYEMRIAAMRKRVGQLESQLLDHRGGDDSQNSVSEQLNNIEHLNKVLTQKNERLENELKILREQFVTAKADIPALRQENDKLRQERTKFIERERDLKSKLDEARAKVRRLKTTSVFAMDHGEDDLVPPPVFVNSGGIIRPSSVRSFQEAVERLLSAARSENIHEDLPSALTEVGSSCQELEMDVDAYKTANAKDPSSWPLDTKILRDATPVMEELDKNMRGLVEAVHRHLNSSGVLPVSLLEAAASHLATSVVDLVKLLHVCVDESKAPPRAIGAGQNELENSTDHIIEGIQKIVKLVREHVPAPNALFAALQSVIDSVRETADICRVEFEKVESGTSGDAMLNTGLYNRNTAREVLEGLENGYLQLKDQLNDIADAHEAAEEQDMDNEIVREFLNETVFKQRLTSALADVAKFTKTLNPWLEK